MIKEMTENTTTQRLACIDIQTTLKVKPFYSKYLLSYKTTFEFEERCAKITTLPGASSQEFFNYFHNILQPKLKLNFNKLEQSGLNSASKWTNNNAE